MKTHGLKMVGSFKGQIISTLPVWTADDEGRKIYVEDEEKRYYADATSWIDYSTVQAVKAYVDTEIIAGRYYADYNEADQGVVVTDGKSLTVGGQDILEFSTDGTLAGDSDTAVPTEKAVKTYVDNKNINNGGFTTLDDTGTPSVSRGTLFLTGGTTAITMLDDGVAGQIVTILNDSDNGLVFTDGATFHLTTNANWTTYHRQTLTMLCTPNSEWVEVARGYQT